MNRPDTPYSTPAAESPGTWSPDLDLKQALILCGLQALGIGAIVAVPALCRLGPASLIPVLTVTGLAVLLSFAAIWFGIESPKRRRRKEALDQLRSSLLKQEPMSEAEYAGHFDGLNTEFLMIVRSAVARFFSVDPAMIVPDITMQPVKNINTAAIVAESVLFPDPARYDFVPPSGGDCTLHEFAERLCRFCETRGIELKH